MLTQEFTYLEPWGSLWRCFNNDEASVPWLVLQNSFWAGQKFCAVGLAVTPKGVHCVGAVESLEYTFFHCIVRLLCELIQGCIFRILYGKFFVLEASL